MENKVKQSKGIAIINLVLIILIIVACIIIIITAMNQNDTSINTTEITDATELENTSVNNSKSANALIVNRTNSSTTDIYVNNVSETATEKKDNFKTFFYNQIDDVSKQMYGLVLTNLNKLQNNENVEIKINEEGAETKFQTAWDAINLDKPEIFYIDTNKISLITQTTRNLFGNSSYKYILEPRNSNYYIDLWNTPQEVKNAIYEVETKGNKIVEPIINNTYMNRFEKVKFVHDYLIKNIEYNQVGSINDANIYGALIEGKAVCEGYAESFKFLLDKLDIPCIIVYGDGINSSGATEYHSWNEVQMDDGKWYAVDATFDDPIIIGNGELPEDVKYRYFLVGSDSFNSSHVAQADVSGTGQNFKYPEISRTDY